MKDKFPLIGLIGLRPRSLPIAVPMGRTNMGTNLTLFPCLGQGFLRQFAIVVGETCLEGLTDVPDVRTLGRE